tara:strand:+ start:25 stop:672 length:648 start_codon:yes stop_codon:yes gene_type:complete
MDNIDVVISNELVDYKDSIQIMEQRIKDIITGEKNELIWFLNHDHIITQGTSASNNEIINAKQIPIIKTNRGGKTTYHGPGQRIVYFMINLNKRKKNVRKFISIIENSLIKFLKDFNIDSKSFNDRIGIWVTDIHNKPLLKEEKIGAIGLRLKKWITYHGLSFNIYNDLIYYDFINACGLKNYKTTSMKKLGFEISNNDFDNKFTEIFLKELEKM